MSKRVIIIVLDSVGIGEMPDSYLYGDQGSNTLANTARAVGGLKIPVLESMGIGNIAEIQGVKSVDRPRASYGKMQERSKGKDTTTGHWEMMGIILDKAFPIYPEGFPLELIAAFEERIGIKTIGNIVASGTEIIEELGAEHMRTGFPIVYTSADSVFQIAAHEEVIPIEKLYTISLQARELLQGEHSVGRVIARPFVGLPGNFKRTANRHDYSLIPPSNTLSLLNKMGKKVVGVGKIHDIFAGQDVAESFRTNDNLDGIAKLRILLNRDDIDLLFVNLLDFDQNYGHRNDPQGYAKALLDFDKELRAILDELKDDDLLIITADHGCDPTQKQSTDHSREFVPLLVYSRRFAGGIDLGIRDTFADIGQATLDYLGLQDNNLPGQSFLPEVLGAK